MSNDLLEAIREWDAAVQKEAAKLIRQGTPPYDAVEKAVRQVIEQRRGPIASKG